MLAIHKLVKFVFLFVNLRVYKHEFDKYRHEYNEMLKKILISDV